LLYNFRLATLIILQVGFGRRAISDVKAFAIPPHLYSPVRIYVSFRQRLLRNFRPTSLCKFCRSALAVNALFEQKPLQYMLINGAYGSVVFTLMGLILGAWH